MASAAESRQFAQDRLDAIADIAESGFLMSFGVLAPGANSYDPPGDYQELAQVNVLPMEWDGDFSDTVLRDDKLYAVADEVDVRSCTHVQHPDGDLYVICTAESIKIDNITNILYIVQTRAVYTGALDT